MAAPVAAVDAPRPARSLRPMLIHPLDTVRQRVANPVRADTFEEPRFPPYHGPRITISEDLGHTPHRVVMPRHPFGGLAPGRKERGAE